MRYRAWACAGTAFALALTGPLSALAQTAPLQPTSVGAPLSLNGVPILSPAAQAALQSALGGRQRIEPTRDRWRNPAATLQFFGVRPTDNVIEIWPGQGWYTSILGPYLKQGGGNLIVGHFDAASSNSSVVRQIVDAYRARFAGDQATYGNLNVVPFGPFSGPVGPAGTADSVLTFRNIHNWMAQGWAEKAFADFFLVLKPGGILGIEEHRGRTDEPQDPLARDGYVREDFVIQLAREAGFDFIGRSEINANPADTKDHPFGVWTLPPVSRTSPLGQRDDPGFDRTRYYAIGESDRMTLRFRKPLSARGGPAPPTTRLSPIIVNPAIVAAGPAAMPRPAPVPVPSPRRNAPPPAVSSNSATSVTAGTLITAARPITTAQLLVPRPQIVSPPNAPSPLSSPVAALPRLTDATIPAITPSSPNITKPSVSVTSVSGLSVGTPAAAPPIGTTSPPGGARAVATIAVSPATAVVPALLSPLVSLTVAPPVPQPAAQPVLPTELPTELPTVGQPSAPSAPPIRGSLSPAEQAAPTALPSPPSARRAATRAPPRPKVRPVTRPLSLKTRPAQRLPAPPPPTTLPEPSIAKAQPSANPAKRPAAPATVRPVTPKAKAKATPSTRPASRRASPPPAISPSAKKKASPPPPAIDPNKPDWVVPRRRN